MPPPKGRSFPFAPRHSADWLVSHVTYDQAVDMFFNQTATQQNLGHDPLVYSKVFRGVTYGTIQEAQQVFTETMNAEYEAREQRDLADENRGCKASKILNDNIRNRIVPTEDGLESLTAYRKPFGEKCLSPLSLFTQSLDGESSSHTQASQSFVNNETQGNASFQPEINPKNAYWPPYNFLAEDGEKEIHVTYTQDVIETTVLAPEEWTEFFDMLDKTQNIGGTATGVYDAFDTAKKLGGFGVTAYVKTHNGVDYLILKGYKQHMKTLLAGNRFKASNPQVVKLGLGALDSVKGMARYVKVTAPMEILVGSAINVLQYVLNDEYTLEKLGVDQAKLLIGIFSSTALASGIAGVLAVASIPITFVAGTIILVGASFTVWAIDKNTDFQNKVVEADRKSVV